jgi:hypothetical protein
MSSHTDAVAVTDPLVIGLVRSKSLTPFLSSLSKYLLSIGIMIDREQVSQFGQHKPSQSQRPATSTVTLQKLKIIS